jgi:hypothetical protein
LPLSEQSWMTILRAARTHAVVAPRKLHGGVAVSVTPEYC